jgi:hypothetical protein
MLDINSECKYKVAESIVACYAKFEFSGYAAQCYEMLLWVYARNVPSWKTVLGVALWGPKCVKNEKSSAK